MSRITLTARKAQALKLLKDNGTMTTAQINARMNFGDASPCGTYNIMAGLKHKGYVEMERDTTPNISGNRPICWTISQAGINHLAFLLTSIEPERPKLAPRVRASFHVGTYRPSRWECPRPEADDHKQFRSLGVRC